MSNVIEKNVIKTEVFFSQDKAHRYLLRKEWDKNKPKAMVIMINPSIATEFLIDHTTMYVMNNLFRLGFGGVDIFNLFTNMDGSRKTKEKLPEIEKENENLMMLSAEKVDSIIVAWGKVGDTQKCIKQRQEMLLKLLEPYEEKVFLIADGNGEIGFHPLAPQIRSGWNLVKFSLRENDEAVQVEQVEQREDIKNENEIK